LLSWAAIVGSPCAPPFRCAILDRQGITPPAQRQGKWREYDKVEEGQEKSCLDVPDLFCRTLPPLPETAHQSWAGFVSDHFHKQQAFALKAMENILRLTGMRA
jgi:hypothetical protein